MIKTLLTTGGPDITNVRMRASEDETSIKVLCIRHLTHLRARSTLETSREQQTSVYLSRIETFRMKISPKPGPSLSWKLAAYPSVVSSPVNGSPSVVGVLRGQRSPVRQLLQQRHQGAHIPVPAGAVDGELREEHLLPALLGG